MTRKHIFVVVVILILGALAAFSAAPAHAAGVVGDGTPASCTESALTAALSFGGLVTFNCGGPKTILVLNAKTIATGTTIDGGDVITLTGGLATRLFNVNPSATLTLRHIVLDSAIAAGTKAEGRIQVVDDAQYRVAYQRVFGSIDADYPDVNAFVERATTPPTVWVHRDRQTPTTVLHESMHLYSNAAVRTTYGSQVNEGITEYFTRIIVRQQNLPKRTGLYDDEYAEVNELVKICGEDVLRRAYFEGNIAGLQSAIDTARSAGTFAAWVTAMQAEDWATARAALAPAPAPAPAPAAP